MNSRKKSLNLVFILCLFLLFSFSKINTSGSYCNENTNFCEINSDELNCNSHDTIISIDEIGIIKVEETIILENLGNNPISSLEFYFPHHFRNLLIFDKEFGLLDYTNTSSILYVSLGNTIDKDETIILKLSYDIISNYYIEIVEDNPDYYDFSFNFQISFRTTIYSMNLRLPENCFTHDISDAYSPNAVIVLSENRLHFSWVYKNLTSQSSKEIYVKFNPPLKSGTPAWVFVISSLSGVSIGVGITYLLIQRKRKLLMQKIGDIFLTEAQKTLLIIISEKGGKMTQGDLVRMSGFSKSKVSRNLAPLEENKFIQREKWGNQYKVTLTDQGKKVID